MKKAFLLTRLWTLLLALVTSLGISASADTKSFVLDIDDPEAYMFLLSGNMLTDLQKENIVSFETEDYPYLSITARGGNKIESVVCGDNTFEVQFGMMCTIDLDESFDGKRIIVRKAGGGGNEVPQYAMTLNIDDIDNIDEVYADGSAITGTLVSGENKIEAAETVSIYIGPWVDYEGRGVSLNGNPVALDEGSTVCYTITAEEYAYINVVTMEPEVYSFTLNVDKADNITSSYLANKTITFTDGENIVDMAKKTMKLTLKLAANYKEHTVKLNGEEMDIAYKTPNYYEFDVTSGDNVEVVTEGATQGGDDPNPPVDPTYDSYLSVKVDAASHVVMTIDSEEIELRNGSNKVGFSFYTYAHFKATDGWKIKRLTVNGEEKDIIPSGCGFILEEDYADAEISVTTAPDVSSKLTMEIEIDSPDHAVVSYDGEALDMSEGIFTLIYEDSYAELRIEPTEGYRLVSVMEDGEEVAINDGIYRLTMTSDYGDLPSKITVITDASTSIDSLPDGSEVIDAYNLQGIPVLRGADKVSIQTLPAGIYIINGRKAIIK